MYLPRMATRMLSPATLSHSLPVSNFNSTPKAYAASKAMNSIMMPGTNTVVSE